MKGIKFKMGFMQVLLNIPKYLILIFFSSCSNNNYEVTSLLPSKMLTEEERITLLQECIINNSFILDSLLILFSNFQCNSSVFSIYHKNTFELIRRFGESGMAPFEFHSPRLYNSCTSSDLPDKTFFYEANLSQNKIIDFYKLTTDANVSECIISESLPKELISTRELNQLSNGRVAGIDLGIRKGMFFIYDPSSGQTIEAPFHPKMRIPEQYRLAYYGLLCTNPSKDVIVFASRYFDQILFYNSDGKLLKEHYFSKIKRPNLSKQLQSVSNESYIYFMKMYGTPERCYALRVARPITELSKAPMQLLSFDWDGNLVKVYEYNSFCDAFCVDESTNKLYCIFENEDEKGPAAIDLVQMLLD